MQIRGFPAQHGIKISDGSGSTKAADIHGEIGLGIVGRQGLVRWKLSEGIRQCNGGSDWRFRDNGDLGHVIE